MADAYGGDGGSRADLVRRALEEKGSVRDLYAEDAVVDKPWNFEKLEDGEGMLQKAFPDLRIEVEDAFESGDQVAVRWRLRGTNKGDVRGIAATGAEVDVSGINIYRFGGGAGGGGQITASWGQADVGGLAAQCGREVFEAVVNPPQDRFTGLAAG